VFATEESLRPYASNPVVKELLSDKMVTASKFQEVFESVRAAPPKFANGSKIKFTGMEKKAELNGTPGTVESFEVRETGHRVYSEYEKKPIPVLEDKLIAATGGRRKTRGRKPRRSTRRR
jgi:hypothetical protein